MKCRLCLQLDSKILIQSNGTRFSTALETQKGNNKWSYLYKDVASDARTTFTKLFKILSFGLKEKLVIPKNLCDL